MAKPPSTSKLPRWRQECVDPAQRQTFAGSTRRRTPEKRSAAPSNGGPMRRSDQPLSNAATEPGPRPDRRSEGTDLGRTRRSRPTTWSRSCLLHNRSTGALYTRKPRSAFTAEGPTSRPVTFSGRSNYIHLKIYESRDNCMCACTDLRYVEHDDDVGYTRIASAASRPSSRHGFIARMDHRSGCCCR